MWTAGDNCGAGIECVEFRSSPTATQGVYTNLIPGSMYWGIRADRIVDPVRFLALDPRSLVIYHQPTETCHSWREVLASSSGGITLTLALKSL